MRDFTEIPKQAFIYEDDHFFIIRDKFPVSPGHLLIISKIVLEDFFALSPEAKLQLTTVIEKAKDLIELDFNPDGYNIGINCGEAAGQTIFHFHCHVIPRYSGDMNDPRGGIRHCVTGKGYY